MRKLRSCILLVLAFMGFNALAISAPSITSCTRTSSTSVSLSWTSVSGASYYVVRRSYTSSVGSSTTLASPTGTSYTDSQAGVDTCYYWVEAWDSSGASARSSMATASSGSGSGGGSSGGFSINASDGTSTEGVIITWSSQSGATGYRVVRGNSSNMDNASILMETVTGTSYTDTTAVASRTYYYWIVAKKSSGYVTSSYNTGYRASSSGSGSGSGSGSSSGSGSGSSYDGQSYTVKFNANGGSGTMAVESFTYDVSKALTANAFTRNGWNFLGWAESASATTAKYTNGQSVKNLAAAGTKNLYAVWDPQGVQLWEGGPYWAKNNLGATSPQGTGYYYRWGDTMGYKRVGSSWNSVDGSVTGFSFDTAVSSFADAATAQRGVPWRMPTSAEIASLWNNTSWTQTKVSGVLGIKFTGKGAYSAKSIFIPSVGYASGTSLIELDRNYTTTAPYYMIPNNATRTRRIIWSSSTSSSSSNATYFYANEEWNDTTDPRFPHDQTGSWLSSTIGTKGGPKYYGLQIRPVISYGN